MSKPYESIEEIEYIRDGKIIEEKLYKWINRYRGCICGEYILDKYGRFIKTCPYRTDPYYEPVKVYNQETKKYENEHPYREKLVFLCPDRHFHYEQQKNKQNHLFDSLRSTL